MDADGNLSRGRFIMEVPLSSLRTLRNADVRRVDMRDFNDLLSHKRQYEEQFYSYDAYSKTYSELIEFFTSNRAFVGHFGGTNDICLCTAKVYYKGKLTGIEAVKLWYKRNGVGISIHVSLSDAYGTKISKSYSLNDALYEVINHRMINLQFDASCRIRYTTRYLRGDFKPINISAKEPYGKFSNSAISGDCTLSLEAKEKLRAKALELEGQSIESYINPEIMKDMNFGRSFNALAWRTNGLK